jgi:hypothetical protein
MSVGGACDDEIERKIADRVSSCPILLIVNPAVEKLHSLANFRS